MKTILFQGDSITDASRTKDVEMYENKFYTHHFGGGYVNAAASKLLLEHPDKFLNVINRGISGNRVVDLYARWKIDALNLKPDIISILIGVNDVWHEYARHNGVEPERFELIYDMLLSWTKEVLPNVKLVIGQPFCLKSEVVSDEFYEDVQVLGAITEKIAEKHNAIFIPYQHLFNEAAKVRENSYYLVDGVHPGLPGAQLMAQALVPAIESLL